MEYFYQSKYKLIYLMRIPDGPHAGLIKVGDTTVDLPIPQAPNNSSILNDAAHRRIRQYTQTVGQRYELLHTELAFYVDGKQKPKGFDDHAVHRVLQRSGIAKEHFNAEHRSDEWFRCDLATARRAIAAVKEGRDALQEHEKTQGQSPIELRAEQRDAVDKTLKHFKKSSQMLWNAKMRFGKTIAALQMVKEHGALRRVLILTHRPVVDAGWHDEFGKVFFDSPAWAYGSKNKGDTFASLESRAAAGDINYVYFASIQDLRGSERVGGNFDKNHEVFSTPWDLIIVDEAHEGTKTDLGSAVIKELTKPATKVLRLSGTPFNLLDDFKDDEVFTWDYVMEQRAKAQWDIDHPGDHNPYADLPRMNILTYDLGRLMGRLAEYDDEGVAFNFTEFFRTRPDGSFVHQADVRSFLDLLTRTDEHSLYPFANARYRDIFRHTLWVLPGVKEAKALAAMLREHPVFGAFDIVNVAGDGDEEEPKDEALRKVRKAIGPDPDATRTITLSCSRLTTGVTVREWTGVLMLRGGLNTAAAAYMQTIFRVQSPATIAGRVKQDCYVFDFAPDRTLRVLAETAKISTKAGAQTASDRQQLGEFLNFCPIIAIAGSRMDRERLTADQLLQQLKRAYVERVVQRGFEDAYLYNDELLRLTDVQIREFDELKGIIGTTKAMAKTADITVNAQGLTREQHEQLSDLSKKPKRELTDQEKARLEELKKKKKVKQDAISILRGISIRMPLMIYGADIRDEDTELTIDNFTQLIDPDSWEEFMPRGVTKQHFNAFKRYYDPDVFTAAAKRIRAMARAADRLTIEQRIERIAAIFATFRNPDKETVLTPWRVVNMHLADTLGGYTFFNADFSDTIEDPRYVDRAPVTPTVFDTRARLLEINSKSGLYPLLLAYNVYRARLRDSLISPDTLAEHQALWDAAVRDSIFVVCKTKMARSITQRTLLGFRPGKVNTYTPDNLINKIKNQPELFIEKVRKLVGNMKITAIVGNPPYQEEGESTRKAPIYHLFYDISFRIAPLVTLITPGRFLFRAGQTPADWMEKMLSDTHFRVVDYFQKSNEVFPSVDIKGGVAIGYWDQNREFGPIGFFSEYPELSSILQKVKAHEEFRLNEFADLISNRGMYRFSDLLFEEYPKAKSALNSGTGNMITSNSFNLYPEIFTENKPETGDEYIQLFGRLGNQRVYRWIKKDYVVQNDYLDYYNVFVPKANGSGALGEILSTPVIGVPVIGHTDTFLSIGKFASAQEASACLAYVRTKFARCLLGTLKATQDNPKDTWANVPMQDFTAGSDIDWTVSIPEIDAQLYRKYALSPDEIAFIESMIRPM